MQVESIVRETLGVKDHRVVEVGRDTDGLRIRMEVRRGRKVRCGECGRRLWPKDILRERRWRHVSLWGIPVYLVYRPRRVRCPEHGVRVEGIPWSLGKRRVSVQLVEVISFWARLLPWAEVGKLFGVSWNTVRSAVEGAVAYGREQENYKGVRHIGIDEISRKKGHVYHTNVYDLDNRRLLWSGAHRTKDSLRRFFEWWGPERTAAIRGVCCDMWQNYIDVIQEYCGEAVIVFDKFHIIKNMLDAIDKVRRMEANALRESGCEVLKGTRYIWLKNPWNLTKKQDKELKALLKSNYKIVRAYLLKELFRRLWEYKRKGWAKKFLKKWFWKATHSRLEPIRKFAWMVRRHEEGILAYLDLRIDNGAVEAMNNNAKVISHRARGYRSEATFSLVQVHCLGRLPLPQTHHKFQ